LFNASKDNVRIGQYKEIDVSLSPAVSVYNILENVCKDKNAQVARKKFKNGVKQVDHNKVEILYNVVGIDYQMFKFDGHKQKPTPVVKLDVALNIINNLSNKVANTTQ
ncbi:hypothetical protein HDU81_001335, partial [Chytriomyces hyalinus]